MTPETIKAIQTALQPIADKIGPGVEFGWATVLRQQYVIACEGIFTSIMGIIAIYIAMRVYKAIIGDDELINHPETMFVLFILIPGCIAFFAGIVIAITHFINPDYYALQFFISLGKSTN